MHYSESEAAVQILLDIWQEELPNEEPPSRLTLGAMLRRIGADVALVTRAIRSTAVMLRTGDYETGNNPQRLLSRKVNHMIAADQRRAEFMAAQGEERRPAPEPEPFDEEWVPFNTKPLKRDAA
jgi:hypothetical protein